MATVTKNRQANEFRARADALRDKLTDTTTVMTRESCNRLVAEIRDLEARAAACAEFTPGGEIGRQGGDDILRRANPEYEDASDETKSFQHSMERFTKRIARVYGGPNRYLLRLAQRLNDPLSPAERALHEEIQAFHKRTIIGDANDASGGEFLLPLQQAGSIFQVENRQFGLADFATRYAVSGRTLRIPYVVQDDAANTRPMSGIANVAIVDEAAEKPEREPKFAQRILNVFKYAAYTEVGDETLSDDFTGDLSPTISRLVGGQVMNKLNEDVTAGAGTTEPLGALHSSNGALLVVNRDTSQSIATTDVFNMYAKHTFGGGQSVWLINRTALPALLSLTLSGNTLVTWLSNLRDGPPMQLLGLPVIMTDILPVLGVQGDLALVNGGFYAFALRQALTVESSIHYRFRHDITAYRFLARAGGIPIPTDTYAYKSDGSTKEAEHSPFVVLGDAIDS